MHSQAAAGLTGRPLVFGEVLFDRFAGEGPVLGGAPFNVAWHLQGFGQNPLFISRIGQDELGERVLEEMKSWGMDTVGMQQDPRYPTGAVQVYLEEDEPRYEILPEQAYDFIRAGEALKAARGEELSLLYQGTLAARCPTSRAALEGLAVGLRLPGFMDVNLRPPWWEKQRVDGLIKASRWVKMNEEELDLLSGFDSGGEKGEEKAAVLLKEMSLAVLIVTLGSRGAFFLQAEGCTRRPAHPVPEVVDTVGAGDAFSAVCILGLSLGWDFRVTLERSLEFASRIVGQRGAIRRDPGPYEHYRGRWAI